jgi:hypothetical protein
VTHRIVEYADRRPMNVPAVYQRSDQMLRRAFISVSPVSPHDIADHIETQTDEHSPAKEFMIRYRFVNDHPTNVRGTSIDIYI